jgi:hypothetical protein
VAAATAGCALAAAAFLAVHLGGPQPLAPSAAKTTMARSAHVAGRLLVRYVAQVPAYHGLIFGPQIGRPFDTRDGRGADLLNRIYDYETRDTFVHVTQQPTYPRCRAAAAFTSVVVAELNKSFCYLGHGLVVGITVLAMSPAQHTFDITVWQA